MSWTDDIRCLFCDGKLPLYRRITDGQFCSAAHRKAYWREHERLAVERLHQTHDSLHAYRPPPGTIEAILGQPAAQDQPDHLSQPEPWTQPEIHAEPDVPGLSGYIPVRPALRFDFRPQTTIADPVALETRPALVCPSAGFAYKEREAASAGPMEMALRDRMGSHHLGHPELGHLEPVHPVRRDVLINSLSGTTEPLVPPPFRAASLEAAGPLVAGPLEIPHLTKGRPGAVPPLKDATWMEAAVPLVRSLSLAIPPQNDELQRLLEDFRAREDEQIPKPQRLYAMNAPLLRDSAGALRQEVEPLPAAPLPAATMLIGVQLPPAGARFNAEPAPGAPLRTPPAQAAAPWHGTLAGNLAAPDDLRRGPEQPLQFALAMPALRPRLRLARGTRYAIQTPASGAPVAEAAPAAFASAPPDIALPQRKAMAAAAASGSGKAAKAPAPSNLSLLEAAGPLPEAAGPLPEAAGPVPDAAGLVSLTFAEANAKPGNPAVSVLAHGLIPQPPRTELMHPASKLEPLDDKPLSDFVPPPAARTNAQPDAVRKAHIWTHAADFLRHAPRDLKTLVFAIPVLLGLALHPSLPKVRVAAPASASGMQRNVERALNAGLVNVRQTMADRAGVALDEDFRSGLDDWVSRGDAAAEWSFDATGFVRPGPLALYRPSLGLTDYQLQFLGMIDEKALSWVVRAADYENYYVIKLTVLKPGPLPTIGITRYAVVNGHADSRVDTLAPIDARPDMLYRVRLDVQGSEYVLSIQGQIVDVWSETRLQHGGIGFFSARGEASRVRWVQVTHQYDMLGRLCAYLAPYNILSTNGSW